MRVQGVVELLAEHEVCTAGQTLTPNQAAILRTFGQRQAEFAVSLLCCWRGGQPNACLPASMHGQIAVLLMICNEPAVVQGTGTGKAQV